MPHFQFALVPPQRPGSGPANHIKILQMECDSNSDATLLGKKIRSTFPGLVFYRIKPPAPPWVPIDVDTSVPPEDAMAFAYYLAQFAIKDPTPAADFAEQHPEPNP